MDPLSTRPLPSVEFVMRCRLSVTTSNDPQKINQTIESHSQQLQKVWKICNETFQTGGSRLPSPQDKALAVIIYYSHGFRIRLLEGNVSPLTADELELYVKEWTELVNYTGDEHKVFDFCVCGHDTSKPFFIGNTLNGNVLKMSKGCASELLSPLIGDVVGIYNQIRGYKGTYKMCGTCLNFKIPPVDDWKDICHDCYSRGKRDPIQPYKIAFHYKTCSDCGKLGVNCSGSNSFKTKCPECLKNNQSSTVASPGEFKVCGGCGSSNIPLSESWKKYCDACYKPALSSATNTNTTSVGTGGQSQTFTGQKVKCPKCQLMRIPAEKAHIFKVCYTCK